MENSCFETFLPTSEETEEPQPKKIKIDTNHLSSEEGQLQLLQKLNHVDKKLSKTSLSFPKVLWNYSQNSLELQVGNNANLKPNIRQRTQFKPHMNANLQSRLLGNITFCEKWTLESNDCNGIRDSGSEFNQNGLLVTKPEFCALCTKEKEKSLESGSSLKGSELPTVNTFFPDILVESVMSRIEFLFKDVQEFQSYKNSTGCQCINEISRSGKQYHIPKPVIDGEASNGKTLHMRLLASSFMKVSKSPLKSLFCENKNVVEEDRNILSCSKQTRFPTHNNFRRNKVFQHMYMLYLRNCAVINLPLVKCAAFKLLLQEKRIYHCRTATEKNHTAIFSQQILLNVQQREVSKEGSTKECLVFSKNTLEDGIFSVADNEKEQMARQFVLSNNQIVPDNNVNSSSLGRRSLCNPRKMQDLTENIGFLNYLSSVPNIFEKLSIKYSSLKTIVTVVTHVEERVRKASNENNILPIKKMKTSHFVLKASRRHTTRRFRNYIYFPSKIKHAPKYIGAFRSAIIGKKWNDHRNVLQESPCGFVEAEAHLSSYETYKKIHLGNNSEEEHLISCLRNRIFNCENNEKYSKVCTDNGARTSYNVLDTLTYHCVPPKLFTNTANCNSILVQENTNKKSQYLENLNTTNQLPRYKISDVPFPINNLNIYKGFSENDQYLTSVTPDYLCVDQNIAVCVKAWKSKIALHGNRGKQSNFKFESIKYILQYYHPICNSRVSNSLEHNKFKKAEHGNFSFHKDSLLRNKYGSDLVFVKQNVKAINGTENKVVEQNYTNKSNQHYDLIVPYFKDESANTVGSKVNLMVVSHTPKQEFSEDIKKHFSSEIKNTYAFEMKNQFDLVLEELHMFNGISKENESNLLFGRRNILQEDPLKQSNSDSILDEDYRNVCENKINLIFSTCGKDTVNHTTATKQNKNEQSLSKDKILTRPGEQEVPHDYCSSSISDEESLYSPSEEHCDYGSKTPSWKSAFVSHTFMKKQSLQRERGPSLLDGFIRVQPLKTCCGPLRIGLSRKAKPKQLHPYLK
ncbi:RAD51-associated protein 2 [Hemicordylus capensis]|uniref:RAD51-associated protein 2 n=1 Tax=Hemicordylus capensis TaxID=884348 RepID=UPI002302C094|nr:RAD51-associated protein 2 [Hemicordylus capensis]XP_053141319.1 RAD51-associated protein 2 [Hemicordylus capensis]XP_053141320.1 RAD51-associated protein 2 [Hemicordylus capensis]XP_053141321.1 RAD51-associated protein 2 [Hemicordylus capensis]XP_053141322.1 RAD51-associated protein 2 [Hemicordylus capensis]XP_053141323.1 RAD51-associated protein 2 [Hemicordylus capensis]